MTPKGLQVFSNIFINNTSGTIFIPFNVPSSKNSKANGRFHSKTVMNYLRSLNIQGYSASRKEVKEYKNPNRPNLFRQYVGTFFEGTEHPILLGMHFVRDSRRKADFHNLCHIVLDLLVAHDYIIDDNMNCVFPVPLKVQGNWYSVDKHNPGVYLKIIEDKWCCTLGTKEV